MLTPKVNNLSLSATYGSTSLPSTPAASNLAFLTYTARSACTLSSKSPKDLKRTPRGHAPMFCDRSRRVYPLGRVQDYHELVEKPGKGSETAERGHGKRQLWMERLMEVAHSQDTESELGRAAREAYSTMASLLCPPLSKWENLVCVSAPRNCWLRSIAGVLLKLFLSSPSATRLPRGDSATTEPRGRMRQTVEAAVSLVIGVLCCGRGVAVIVSCI